MSTIKAEISAQTIANQIRLERAAHLGSFLLVEGDADARLFKKFVCPECCSVVVCVGNANVASTLFILREGKFLGVLGVADRDYGDLLGGVADPDDLILTDENDCEIMVLCSDALDNVLREYATVGKCAAEAALRGKPVRDLIFDASAVIGAVRIVAQQRDLPISFKGQTYQFESNSEYTINLDRTVQHLIARSPALTGVKWDEVASAARELLKAGHPAKKLCNGHDCIRVLGRALKAKLGTDNQFNSEDRAGDLGKVLRLAYERAYFEATGMNKKMKSWETSTGFNIFGQLETDKLQGQTSDAETGSTE
jgi:hypothetical protein